VERWTRKRPSDDITHLHGLADQVAEGAKKRQEDLGRIEGPRGKGKENQKKNKKTALRRKIKRSSPCPRIGKRRRRQKEVNRRGKGDA